MKIVSSFDDGAVHDVKLAELLKKYDIPAIFYWPVAMEKSYNLTKVRSFLTEKQCLEIAKDFEIGSHGYWHYYLTRINDAQLEIEIEKSRRCWQNITGQLINSFCYPRGYANDKIRELVKKAGYKNARNTLVGHTESSDPYWTNTSVHIGVNRQDYDGKTWQQFARDMLIKAKETDGIFHMFGHSWEIEKENAWHDLEELLKELK